MSTILGIDIGGTKIAYGVVNSDAELSQEGRIETPDTLEALVAAVQKIIREIKPDALGIAVPGTIDSRKGIVTDAPNLPYLRGVHIVKELGVELPIVLDNDARAALVAEAWMGAANDVTSAVLITLGTGVGGAVMQKGTVLPHPTDITQEIGHIKANSFDPFPARSGAGTVEALLGKRNLERRFDISLNEVVTGARGGDAEMAEIVTVIQDFLADAITAIHQVYSCKKVVIGGGGSEQLDLYMLPAEEYPCPVVPATFGVKAGVVGAAKLASEVWLAIEKDREEWDIE